MTSSIVIVIQKPNPNQKLYLWPHEDCFTYIVFVCLCYVCKGREKENALLRGLCSLCPTLMLYCDCCITLLCVLGFGDRELYFRYFILNLFFIVQQLNSAKMNSMLLKWELSLWRAKNSLMAILFLCSVMTKWALMLRMLVISTWYLLLLSYIFTFTLWAYYLLLSFLG